MSERTPLSASLNNAMSNVLEFTRIWESLFSCSVVTTVYKEGQVDDVFFGQIQSLRHLTGKGCVASLSQWP